VRFRRYRLAHKYMLAIRFLSISLFFGSLNLTADSIDYRREVQLIWGSQCSDVISLNDSTLLIASFDGVVSLLNNRTREFKRIWETNHSIEKIAIDDTIVAVLGAKNLYLITITGEVIYHVFDERFLLGKLIHLDNKVLIYTVNNIYAYDTKAKEGRFSKTFAPLSRLLYSNHQYILAFEDGYVEIRRNIDGVKSKRLKLHYTKLNFIDKFDGGFISCSLDSFKIWDPEFRALKSEALSTSKNVIEFNGALVWSNYEEEFYQYDIRAGMLTIHYDSSLKAQAKLYENVTEGVILFYDLNEDRIDTIPSSGLRAEILTLSADYDSLLLATYDGRICSTALDSINFSCGIRDQYYVQPLLLSLSDNFVMIGASRFCKIKTLGKNENIIEMAHGFVAFNGGHFLKDDNYAVVTVSSNRFSYLRLMRLMVSQNKGKKGNRKKEIEPWSNDFCQDTMPILTSAFISESNLLVFSRGQELIFFDCVRKVVSKTIWVDRPVTCIYYLKSKHELTIGDEEGFIRLYSMGENRWLSEYERYSSEALVSIGSTRFGDTLFLSSHSEIVVVYQGASQRRYKYSEGLTNLVYSPVSQQLIYATPKTARRNYYEWETGVQNTDSAKNNKDVVAGILKIIPSRGGYFLLTVSRLYYYSLHNTR